MPVSRLSSITRINSMNRVPIDGTFQWKGNAEVTTYTPYTWLNTSKSSVKTPNYRQLRLHGTLPDNPFGISVQTVEGHHISRALSGADFVESLTCTHWLGANYPLLSNSAYDATNVFLRNRCVAKMYEQASGGQWNVPVFAVEVGKTAKMVAERATDLVMLLRALRRGDFGWFAAHLRGAIAPSDLQKAGKKFNKQFGRDAEKAVTNAWMELKYGWTPFVKDVYDAMEALFDMADEDYSRIGSVSAKQRSTSSETVNVGPSGDGFGAGGLNYKYTDRISRSVRTTWRYKLRPGSIGARFSLQDPLSVMWELFPLSFVADWFAPVGTYLSCLNSEQRFDTLSTSTGYRLEVNRAYAIRPTFNGYVYLLRPAKSYQLDVVRAVGSAPPSWAATGLFNFNNVRFAASQAATSIALLLQTTSRFRR